jgi:hypothetical protein
MPMNGYTYVNLIWNNISSSKLAAGRACSANKSISSCSNYTGVALSYSEVHYWSRQLLMCREYVEDASRSGRLLVSVFSFKFRVH